MKVSILEITLNVEKNGVMSNFELNIFKALKIIRTSPPLKKKKSNKGSEVGKAFIAMPNPRDRFLPGRKCKILNTFLRL